MWDRTQGKIADYFCCHRLTIALQSIFPSYDPRRTRFILFSCLFGVHCFLSIKFIGVNIHSCCFMFCDCTYVNLMELDWHKSSGGEDSCRIFFNNE